MHYCFIKAIRHGHFSAHHLLIGMLSCYKAFLMDGSDSKLRLLLNLRDCGIACLIFCNMAIDIILRSTERLSF